VGLRQIGRANLDGSSAEILLSAADGLVAPAHIALDRVAGKMYWSDHGSHTISRANLDGSETEILINAGLYTPSGLALSIAAPEIQRSYVPLIQYSD